MGKHVKKSKNKTLKVVICVLVIALIVAAAVLLITHFRHKDSPEPVVDPGKESNTDSGADSGEKQETDDEKTDGNEDADIQIETEGFKTIALTGGVRVTGMGSYAGLYVEDGSDEIVNGVAVVIVENVGDEMIQYLTFTLTGDDGVNYEFELTTLLPGAKMTALDKNRAAYDPAVKITSYELGNLALFSEEPSLHADKISLSADGNAITVKNISDATIASGRVFYKNISGDKLIGGITYTVSFPELAPGEEITLSPSHFNNGSSRIMFVTYAG